MNQEDAVQVGPFPEEILRDIAEIIAFIYDEPEVGRFFADAGFPEFTYQSPFPRNYWEYVLLDSDTPVEDLVYEHRHSRILEFLRDLNCRKDSPRDIIQVIEKLADPKQYLQDDGPDKYAWVISSLNEALIFHGLKIDEQNRVVPSGYPPPTAPLAVPSAKREVELFERLAIHPKIREVSEKRFADGHYADAIFNAFKAIEIAVKEKSGLRDLYGKSLMSTAFSLKAPRLRSNALETTTEQNEQEGFMFLFMGAMAALRNPGGHEIGAEPDVHYTLWCLGLASLLMTKVDEAVRADSEPDRACG